MVSKYWEKWDSVGGKRLDYGTDIIIVDLNSAMTLLNATKVIQGMAAKNLKGKGFVYTSQISAAILPSASYRPVLIKGSSVGGSFIKKQSNLIAIK
jgi:hypothetical protein